MIDVKETLEFREAQIKDVPAIVEIHNSNFIENLSEIEKQGFVLEEIDADYLTSKINDPKNTYYVLALNKLVVGYVSLSKTIDKDILDTVKWETAFDKNVLFAENHNYISVVAIKSIFKRKGLGQYIYNQLFEKYPDSVFTAFIAIEPLSNQKSLDFHIRQGFQIGGTFTRVHFCRLNNYKSLFLYKLC